ncbi:VOC family protein [Candidatus Dojkabacteria bacterium]|jgi:predicted 3-demethylubiquinone-9 3-methyltransferase (glyoxalase superfamily)|uniref:VOC family protein n=1 Tax=Candidatus Dojkabacteria bacterium TaxID=2099670 RepID=A0A955I9I8_9BACT|nr:VOC family protein [Candidatus Dojkabacteria bacterium]
MQKITPCLWFDMNCEEAVNYYVETFNNSPLKRVESKIISIMRYEAGMQTPSIEQMVGKIITVIFELNGQRFMALDGGSDFKLSEATSFEIECEDQAEVDYFWEKLSAVPESEQCGWLKDQFGLSWQIVPKRLGELLSDPDKEKANRVLNAMLEMKKIDVAELERVGKGE